MCHLNWIASSSSPSPALPQHSPSLSLSPYLLNAFPQENFPSNSQNAPNLSKLYALRIGYSWARSSAIWFLRIDAFSVNSEHKHRLKGPMTVT